MTYDAAPERALLRAVIERAVLDAQAIPGKSDVGGNPITRKNPPKARQWLFEWRESDIDIPFSFPWVCMYLNVEPGEVAERIAELLAKGVYVAPPRSGSLFTVNRIMNGTTGTATELEVYFL